MVRSAAGITRSGAGGLGKHIHVVVGCPGLLSDVPIATAAFYIVFNPAAGGLVLPSNVDEFNFHLAGFEPDEDVSGVDFEGLARTVVGLDVPMEISSISPYLIHERIADSYRVGRVFIAGDAAHLFCPFGGFNMNTGIGDACNLGWKLAACLQGWGHDALLDSYEAERRPIALRNCAEATFNVGALVAAVDDVMQNGVPLDDEPESERARIEMGAELYRRTFREWNVLGVVLDQRYSSSVLVDDGSQGPEWDVTKYVPWAKPGHRAPHVWLSPDVSLYDECGHGLALLDLGARSEMVDTFVAGAAERGVPLRIIAIDDPDARALYEAPLVLVRPDQHVAWRGESLEEDAGRIIDTVRGVASAGRERALPASPGLRMQT